MNFKLILTLLILPAFISGCKGSQPEEEAGTVEFIESVGWQDNANISEIFDRAGASGTFVVYDPAANHFIGHNRMRANTRFPPASTFKIPNTLIGLSAGAVGSVDEILPYGGEPQRFRSWERDMGLREAMVVSSVPVYQELARRIGLNAMREHITQINYGNADIGTSVDTFWLVGPLTISAVEQARFLERLAADTLPYPVSLQASVREIVELERHGTITLYGKTGWAFEAGIGWWVGWVEKDGVNYPFALNIDMRDLADAGKRIELGKASLAALGLYP